MKRPPNRPGSDRKNGFLFLGNHLALDFLNTRPVQNGEATELLPDFEALLRWFQAAELLSPGETAKIRRWWGESSRARRSVQLVRELRERLRNEVLAWEAGAAVHRGITDELNRMMAEHPMRSRLETTRKGVVRERWFETEQPEDLLAPLADSAATLFAEVS